MVNNVDKTKWVDNNGQLSIGKKKEIFKNWPGNHGYGGHFENKRFPSIPKSQN